MVLDLSLFSGLSLELAYQEFKARFSQSEKYQQLVESKQTGDAEMVEDTNEETKDSVIEETKESKGSSKGVKYYKKGEVLPVIASECPGWVCYAEKRVGDLVLPNMSKTKSPQ